MAHLVDEEDAGETMTTPSLRKDTSLQDRMQYCLKQLNVYNDHKKWKWWIRRRVLRELSKMYASKQKSDKAKTVADITTIEWYHYISVW